jgi:hypothetical protein
MLINILSITRDIGWMIYGGTIISFTLLLPLISRVDREKQFRSFMSLGPILGLSLGGVIFSCLLIRWIDVGHYYAQGSIEKFAFSFGLLLWVSNIILEIWTLDPIRKALNPELERNFNIENSQKKVILHLGFQSSLICITHILFKLNAL